MSAYGDATTPFGGTIHLKDLTWEWDKVAEAQTLVVLLLSLHSLQRISAVDTTQIWPVRTLGLSCLWQQLYGRGPHTYKYSTDRALAAS